MCILTTAVNSISDNLVADDIYYNIAKTGEGQLREKMSRFLAFAYKVKSAEEAKEKIKETQNAWHDARHVCWAYVIGPKGEEWQLNDNGDTRTDPQPRTDGCAGLRGALFRRYQIRDIRPHSGLSRGSLAGA